MLRDMDSAVERLARVPELSPALAERRAPWSLPQRIAFRFAFAYLVLYSLPFPLTEPPETEKLGAGYDWLWHKAVVWFGAHVLHLAAPITIFTNGSGDTTYNWVQVLCFALVALTATVAWSIVDRRRARYDALWEFLRIYVRYVLATIMFGYGFAKLFMGQFGPPSESRLLQPFGEASPMGLLWTFMGASTPYTMFGGAAEVLGGALLLFRRTTTLGALILIGVMGNVVMLNLCYDVPVKLYALHLWLMAVFLMLPDLRRLADVLVLHRPTTPAGIDPPFRTGRLRWARRVLKALFVVNLLYGNISSSLENIKRYGAGAPKGALDGVWSIEELDGAGKPVATPTWRRVNFTSYGTMSITKLHGENARYRVTDDAVKKTLTLTPFAGNPPKSMVLSYQRTGTDHATLDGQFEGQPFHARLLKIDTSKSLLMTRGFHWINEYPFNR